MNMAYGFTTNYMAWIYFVVDVLKLDREFSRKVPKWQSFLQRLLFQENPYEFPQPRVFFTNGVINIG